MLNRIKTDFIKSEYDIILKLIYLIYKHIIVYRYKFFNFKKGGS